MSAGLLIAAKPGSMNVMAASLTGSMFILSPIANLMSQGASSVLSVMTLTKPTTMLNGVSAAPEAKTARGVVMKGLVVKGIEAKDGEAKGGEAPVKAIKIFSALSKSP